MWYIQCINRGILWNPSKTSTIGKVTFVLYKEVSFIQVFLNYEVLTCTFNTKILLTVLLECNDLLHFYKLYYLSEPEPTSPTLGYATVLNITIGIVYEVDLNSYRW